VGEPFGVIARLKYDRLPVVYRLHLGIRTVVNTEKVSSHFSVFGFFHGDQTPAKPIM
jgi:hypothetical protein